MIRLQNQPATHRVDNQSATHRLSFGAAVRSRRRSLGISQEKLAERAGLHRTYICDIEHGARNVSLDNIDRLAKALEIQAAALFGGFEPALPTPS